VVAWHQRVMFIGFAVPLPPLVELALGQIPPSDFFNATYS
jgi:hypothetical protein